MSTSATVRGSVHRDVSARRFRDPLQVPIGLGFDEERPTVRQAARDFAVWLAIVCGAALAVYFVAASVPELKAAATHHHASATAASASSAQRVSDHQRADTGS